MSKRIKRELSTSLLLLIITAITTCSLIRIINGQSSGFCPSMCVCKWKSGKQSVECTDKGLITIPEEVDPETQLLDMSGNNLQVLPNKTFVRAALLNLQRIYLKNCHIGQIDDRALDGLSNVVELDLSKNLLTSVPSSIFEDVPNLRDLSLARNPIQKIESRAFRFVSGLVRLDLSHCQLRTIASDAFSDVDTLESLKLNGNNLRELKPKTIEVLNGLHGVDLHDNPWYCDCNLRAVKIWLTAKNIPHPVHPVCSGGPMRVLNMSFKELAIDDFACKPEMRVKPDARFVEGVIGENATVTCRVESIPESKITWYWNGRPVTNNSAFGNHQRVLIVESGQMDKKSSLIVMNAQETDSSSLHCIAQNQAGSTETNFTLRVTNSIATFAMFTNGQMAGLSVALIFLIFSILLIIVYLLLRIKKIPPYDVKSRNNDELPNGNACIVSRSSEKQLSVSPVVVSQDGGPSLPTQTYNNAEANNTNAVSSYYAAADCFDRGAGGSGFVNGAKDSSNPDLIADTRRLQSLPLAGDHHRAAWSENDIIERYLNSSSTRCDSHTSEFVGTSVDSNDRTPIIEDVRECEDDVNDYLTLPRYNVRFGGGIENKISSSLEAIVGSSAALSPSSIPSTGYPNAKTIRVWQKGVQVLPPVSTLKRVLSRNSPDEGYQEGCGTDV